MRHRVDNLFAVEREHETQRCVGRWMLRTEVQRPEVLFVWSIRSECISYLKRHRLLRVRELVALVVGWGSDFVGDRFLALCSGYDWEVVTLATTFQGITFA